MLILICRAPKSYIPINDLPMAARLVSQPIDGTTFGEYNDFGSQWPAVALSPPYSSGGEWAEYDSPTHNYPPSYDQPYYQQFRTRESSTASIVDQWQAPVTSRSPISTSSSTIFWSQYYSRIRDSSTLPLANDSSSSICSSGPVSDAHTYAFNGLAHYNSAYDSSAMIVSAEERDEIERNELSTPLAFEEQTFHQPQEHALQIVEQRYLDAYSHLFHPLFPVVHKASIASNGTSPLLKAAILALGAQYMTEKADITAARILHERCLKCRERVKTDISSRVDYNTN